MKCLDATVEQLDKSGELRKRMDADTRLAQGTLGATRRVERDAELLEAMREVDPELDALLCDLRTKLQSAGKKTAEHEAPCPIIRMPISRASATVAPAVTGRSSSSTTWPSSPMWRTAWLPTWLPTLASSTSKIATTRKP